MNLNLMMKFAAAMLGLAALTGCGGGNPDEDGDGKLYVDVRWAGEGYLMQESTIRPIITGLENGEPHCYLKSGNLPPGMAFTDTCYIVGKPRAAGTYNFVADFSVENANNHLSFGGSMTVFGPSMLYSIPNQLQLGQALDVSPMNTAWKPNAGTTIAYQVIDGALVPGFTLDPVTGRISGTVNATGSFSARIGATVTADVGSVQVAQDVPLRFSVAGSTLGYPNVPGAVGVPLAPVAPTGKQPGASYSFAWEGGFTPPAGLQLDPSTGTITGTPSQALVSSTLRIAVTVTVGSTTTMQLVQVSYAATLPFSIRYVCPSGMVGQPFLCKPGVSVVPQATSAGISAASAPFQYVLDSGALPPGLTLDASTGTISGTPSARVGTVFNNYRATVTLGGVVFDLTAGAAISIN